MSEELKKGEIITENAVTEESVDQRTDDVKQTEIEDFEQMDFTQVPMSFYRNMIAQAKKDRDDETRKTMEIASLLRLRMALVENTDYSEIYERTQDSFYKSGIYGLKDGNGVTHYVPKSKAQKSLEGLEIALKVLAFVIPFVVVFGISMSILLGGEDPAWKAVVYSLLAAVLTGGVAGVILFFIVKALCAAFIPLKPNYTAMAQLKKQLIERAKKELDEYIEEKQPKYIDADDIATDFDFLLHSTDWAKINYLIYYMGSGRADSVKEALRLYDEEERHQTLINDLGILNSKIEQTQIQMEANYESILASLGNIATQQAVSSAKIKSSINNVNSNLSEVNRKLQELK